MVDVDIDEIAGAVGKFDNEARDRYAVVLELALNDRAPELTRGACRIGHIQCDARSVAQLGKRLQDNEH